jgi:hypothetical protein
MDSDYHHEAGRGARAVGRVVSECPHKVSSPEGVAWLRGWNEQDVHERGHLTGKANGLQQRADARVAGLMPAAATPAQIEAATLMHEVEEATRTCGPNRRQSPWLNDRLWVEANTVFGPVNWQPVTSAFRNLTMTINDIDISSFVKTFTFGVEATKGIDTKPEPGQLKTIRGKPAGRVKHRVCPKHGTPIGQRCPCLR